MGTVINLRQLATQHNMYRLIIYANDTYEQEASAVSINKRLAEELRKLKPTRRTMQLEKCFNKILDRYVNGEWTYNNFVGNRWNNVSAEDRRLYLKNAYRVLLTRARQGMAIFVLAGSDDDQTRKRELYDGIYGYLKEIGIQTI